LAQTPRQFTKPALDLPAQIVLLEQRGLTIGNRVHAQQSLRHIGYYRLSGYMRPFQQPSGNHQFFAGTTFEQITDLYSFDRKLRVIFLDALDRVEVGLRAATTQALCQLHGSHWYLASTNFLPTANHRALIACLQEEIGHDDEKKRAVHIQHYYSNYDNPSMPPSWMLLEALSFGSLVHILRKLNAQNLKAISRLIGITDRALRSWSLSLSYLRNLCAHQERVWNRTYTIKPFITSQHRIDLTPNDKTYAQAVVLYTMLGLFSARTGWKSRLVGLFTDHPKVNVAKMGFPNEWDGRQVWR